MPRGFDDMAVPLNTNLQRQATRQEAPPQEPHTEWLDSPGWTDDDWEMTGSEEQAMEEAILLEPQPLPTTPVLDLVKCAGLDSR